MSEQCPTCGGPVTVDTGQEGTSHYRPVRPSPHLYGRALDAVEKGVAAPGTTLRFVADALDGIDVIRSDEHVLGRYLDWSGRMSRYAWLPAVAQRLMRSLHARLEEARRDMPNMQEAG